MKYTKSSPIGLGKLERERLSAILRQTQITVSVREATDILEIPRQKAGKLLATYAKKGWLTRISSGIYIPVPLESESVELALENPLAIAEKLFAPCYIAGWSAAEYWSMTEQIFQSVIVMTQRQQKNYKPRIKNTKYLLHFTRPSLFFGLTTVWQNNIKVPISDPTRTIIDLINNPTLGGGIRSTLDIVKNYFLSDEKLVDLLIKYLRKLNNGAAYKRCGFLIEKYFPMEDCLIDECRKNLTTGNARLDTGLDCNKLVTKWRLLVPENWR